MPPLAASLVACAFSSISLLDTSDIYKTKKCIQHKEATRYARNYVQLMQNFIDVMKQTFSVYLTIIRKKNICFITSKMSATFLIFFYEEFILNVFQCMGSTCMSNDPFKVTCFYCAAKTKMELKLYFP